MCGRRVIQWCWTLRSISFIIPPNLPAKSVHMTTSFFPHADFFSSKVFASGFFFLRFQVLRTGVHDGKFTSSAEIYSDDGSTLTASTVAVPYKGSVLIGTVKHKALHCKTVGVNTLLKLKWTFSLDVFVMTIRLFTRITQELSDSFISLGSDFVADNSGQPSLHYTTVRPADFSLPQNCAVTRFFDFSALKKREKRNCGKKASSIKKVRPVCW